MASKDSVDVVVVMTSSGPTDDPQQQANMLTNTAATLTSLANSLTPKRGRGRPKKDENQTPKKGRGRPKKAENPPPKKGRGRPKKEAENPPPKKGRGRPKKAENPNKEKEVKKKRGRPLKRPLQKEDVVEDEEEAKKVKKNNEDVDECPVCLEEPVHPVKLTCGHKFCFLCAKGLTENTLNLGFGGSCPLCRRPIDRNLFKHPNVQAGPEQQQVKKAKSHHWFYEGRDGWWRFEERHNKDIEALFTEMNKKKNKKAADFLICGHIYVLDFDNMLQFRKDGSGRVRRIKRDLLVNVAAKGVAGLAVQPK